MPRTLHPAVLQRRRAPKYNPDTAQLGDPLAVLSAAASGLSALSGALSGSSHKFAGTTFEGAEQARADAGALGVAAGSVEAGRYLLGQHKSDTSPYAQSATAAAIQQASAANPQVMQQAQSAGPLTDQADGSGVLGILWQLKVPLTDPYAGYSTNTGGPGSATAMQLAAQLRQLPPLASMPSMPVTAIPSSAGSPVVSTISTTPPALTTAGMAGSLPLDQLQKLAQQVASGALSLSQLGGLASQDLQLIQAQVAAIKTGQVPPGGFATFVQQNKPLLYLGGGALLVGAGIFALGRRH